MNNLFEQLENSFDNILKSIANYKLKLEKTVENLKSKEVEYTDMYSSIPENEKILRSIEENLKLKKSFSIIIAKERRGSN